MEDEIKSIRKNDVWKLFDLPRGRRVIRVKWILKMFYYGYYSESKPGNTPYEH